MRRYLIAIPMLTLLAFAMGAPLVVSGEKAPVFNNNTVKNAKNTNYYSQSSNYYKDERPQRIQIVPPPQDDPERGAYDKEQSHKASMEFVGIAISVLTAIIFFFQLIIFGRQASRLSETVIATEKAAEAAKASASCLKMIERAYVFASVRTENGFAIVDLKNHGRTPAVLKSVYPQLGFHNTPPQTIDDRPRSVIPDGIGIGSNEVWPATVLPELSEFVPPIRMSEQGFTLFCYGSIDYRDVLQDKRNTGFCWQFDSEHNQWSIAKSDLNYYDKDQNET